VYANKTRKEKFSDPGENCQQNVTDLAGSLVTSSRPPGRTQRRPDDRTSNAGVAVRTADGSRRTADAADIVCYIAQPYTHTHLTALCPGLPGSAASRKVKPVWILLKQETVSSSGISWAICKSAHRSRRTPAPRHSVFYRLDALLAVQPTESKH